MKIEIDTDKIPPAKVREFIELIEEHKRWFSIPPNPDHVPTAYGYRRVSHPDSVETGLGLGDQKDVIEGFYDWLETRKRATGEEIQWGALFTDEAVSALKVPLIRRPEGAKLHMELRRGDHVIFSRLDRAFADMRDFSAQLNMWHERGIHVHFATENVDASTAAGQFALNQMCLMAQWYRQYVSERTKEAFRQMEKIVGIRAGKPWPGFVAIRRNGKLMGIRPDPCMRHIIREAWRLNRVERIRIRQLVPIVNEMLRKAGYDTRWRRARLGTVIKFEEDVVQPAIEAGLIVDG